MSYVGGGRMHEMHYVCYWDLLSNIPSLDGSKVSITEESKEDYVFITNGSIVESSDLGSMTAPPKLKDKASSGSWTLWEKIAKKDPTFHEHRENFSRNYHLKITEKMQPIMAAGKANCIPVMMPFVDSLFMPRGFGDRHEVIPNGSANFAFLGQFAEVANDCVFTVEYSVRCAQTAVYSFFETDKEVLPIYLGHHDPEVLINATKALNR